MDYSELDVLIGVNECLITCAGIQFRAFFPSHIKCSQNSLWVHCNTEQNEVATEDQKINEFISLKHVNCTQHLFSFPITQCTTFK